MSTKTITPRKMIHALRYGKNVKQTTLAFKRIVSRKYPNDPYVIGSACALGKIGLTLDVDFINEDRVTNMFGKTIARDIVTWNDGNLMTFEQIADMLEEKYALNLDTSFDVPVFVDPRPVLEIDRA